MNAQFPALAAAICDRAQQVIPNWSRDDIYVVFFALDFEDADLAAPTVTLGFNTEAQVKRTLRDVGDEAEARWFGGVLLAECQKGFCTFGPDFFEEVVETLGLADADDADEDAWDALSEKAERAMKELLVDAIRRLRASDAFAAKFGADVPVLIVDEYEECDYSAENLEFNRQANDGALPEEFVEFYQSILDE